MSKIVTCKWNPDIKNSGQSMIMKQIIRNIQSGNIATLDIDLVVLAADLSQLIARKRKAVMEIIMDYNVSNPELIKVMSKKGSAPYGGLHSLNDSNGDESTSFDLLKLPHSLVMVLNEFISLHKMHKK